MTNRPLVVGLSFDQLFKSLFSMSVYEAQMACETHVQLQCVVLNLRSERLNSHNRTLNAAILPNPISVIVRLNIIVVTNGTPSAERIHDSITTTIH